MTEPFGLYHGRLEHVTGVIKKKINPDVDNWSELIPLMYFYYCDMQLISFAFLCEDLSLLQHFVDFLSYFFSAGHGTHHEAGT